MQRPGPLQELPLELFLPTYSNLPSKSVRSYKRQLSPGSPNYYSPTKRRILNSEGIFAPEKTCKTPMSFGKASPARFSDVLAGSASPARILDFGVPKNHGGEPAKRPFPTQIQTPLLPSRKTLTLPPELKYRRVSPAHHFSSGLPADAEVSSTSSTPPAVVPTVILRKLPLPPDPQSIHYPGFAVFQDTHTTIYPANSVPERVSDVETHTEPFKENLPPLRQTLRKATLETPKLEGTPVRKSKSATGAPNRVISSCSPMKVDARKKLRRMMEEDDLEEEQNDDDK